MRLLVRSALVFVPVCRGLAYERHGVGRVAFFSSMDGLPCNKKTHTGIDPPTAARACEQQPMSGVRRLASLGRFVDSRLARLASLGSLGGRLWTRR